MSDILFDIKGLRKEYRLNQGLFRKATVINAVNGIDFSVGRGEILSLVGESGCGKTTVAKLILGIEEPSSGEIWFKDRRLADFTPQDWRSYRQQVQMIFQDPYSSLNPRWNVGAIISEPLLLGAKLSAAQIKERVLGLMDKVGLARAWYHRYPHQFSGGQRQRIGIARALALQPEVIVCDEPVSALDVSIQAQVLNLLLDLQQEFGLTYIFISHDLGVVEHISDRIIVMYFGNIVEEKEVEALFAHPEHPYTQKLLHSIPALPTKSATQGSPGP